MTAPLPDPLIVRPTNRVAGTIRVPGDKSISHRAVFCGALANGVTHVSGWLPSEDCHASRRAMEALGARIEWDGADRLVIHGTGGLHASEPVTLDCGNSGTSMRLMLGLIAGQHISEPVTMTGDASLSTRPMDRVLKPLAQMGATCESTGGHAPVVVRGGRLHGTTYRSPIASAQVKSAILLAALTAGGTTTVIEPAQSRDHTERMLRSFGVEVHSEGTTVTLTGPQSLTPTDVRVPGDLSSAAFFFCAAAAKPGWSVTVENCGCNPTRMGVLDVLAAMGCNIDGVPDDDGILEPMGDVTVTGPERLQGIEITGELSLRALDELPMLAVLATQAHGRTVIADAEELRVKESDRIAQVVRALHECGVDITGTDAGFIIDGPQQIHAGTVDSCGDHRIAMSMAIAALWSTGPITIRGSHIIATSFPGFVDLLGAVAPGSV